MNSKLASALAFTVILVLSTASAQTGNRAAIPGGPLETAPQRTPTLTNAQLSARVVQRETLNALVEGYSTHRHNFNDDMSGDVSAHDITGFPHQ